MAKSAAEEMAAVKSSCAVTAQKGDECRSALKALKTKAHKDAEQAKKQLDNAVFETRQTN